MPSFYVGFFFFFYFFTSFSSPISFSEITPNATLLNVRGMTEMQVVLREESQTGDLASLVETKCHCLEIRLSAQSKWVVCTSSPWGSAQAALTGKTTGMQERSELVFTG